MAKKNSTWKKEGGFRFRMPAKTVDVTEFRICLVDAAESIEDGEVWTWEVTVASDSLDEVAYEAFTNFADAINYVASFAKG